MKQRTITVTLTFEDDADAASIDAAVKSITADINLLVQDEYTRAGADRWLPSEGVPAADFAFATSAVVAVPQPAPRNLLHFGSPS